MSIFFSTKCKSKYIPLVFGGYKLQIECYCCYLQIIIRQQRYKIDSEIAEELAVSPIVGWCCQWWHNSEGWDNLTRGTHVSRKIIDIVLVRVMVRTFNWIAIKICQSFSTIKLRTKRTNIWRTIENKNKDLDQTWLWFTKEKCYNFFNPWYPKMQWRCKGSKLGKLLVSWWNCCAPFSSERLMSYDVHFLSIH